ncbi:MAG: NAD(P)/FAD-dependent oxidoreductase [Alphaproteobacteria bacterium]
MPDMMLTPDFKNTPYWWEAAPRPELDEKPLPRETDVAVVGSGFTGLSAALTLARGGKAVTVLEAETPGYGASTRNSGFVGCQLWSKLTPLVKKFGEERASVLAREALAAHDYVVSLIEREQIACHFTYCGRLISAHSPTAYVTLSKELDLMKRLFGFEGHMVPREQQRTEINTDLYYGGMIVKKGGSLHPGLYHAGLLDRAMGAGAAVHGKTPVLSIEREPSGRFRVTTPRGVVSAGRVVLGTNGYTGKGLDWFRRRLIPVHAGVVVSEEIGAERVKSVLPTGRTMIDTRINPYSARPSPDGTRLQFASARGLFVRDYPAKAMEMHRAMVETFPTLRDVRIAYCWTGQMGFSFDKLPHVGERDGVLYALGYCGTGIPMATWLGHKLGQRVLGAPDSGSALDGRGFPTRPFYTGNPWFLPLVIKWYGHKDKRGVPARKTA